MDFVNPSPTVNMFSLHTVFKINLLNVVTANVRTHRRDRRVSDSTVLDNNLVWLCKFWAITRYPSGHMTQWWHPYCVKMTLRRHFDKISTLSLRIIRFPLGCIDIHWNAYVYIRWVLVWNKWSLPMILYTTADDYQNLYQSCCNQYIHF